MLAFAVACRCGITLVDWVGARGGSGVMPLLGVLARGSRGNGSPSPSPSPARSSGACPQRQRRGTSQPSGRGGVRVRVVPRRVVGPLLGAAGGALPCRGGGSGGASRGGVGDRGPGPASGSCGPSCASWDCDHCPAMLGRWRRWKSPKERRLVGQHDEGHWELGLLPAIPDEDVGRQRPVVPTPPP
jgi:hypothetical protein